MPVSTTVSRRRLLQTLACGCAAAASGVASPAAFSADPAAKTNLSAADALARLKAGNASFVAGGACVPAGGPSVIASLANGQAPFAVIVACSDSRTPPEHIFGGGLGDLFVVRVAGNTVDQTALGSIEYGVGVLGAPLVLVLGHSGCGAVEAAIKIVTAGAIFPGSIGEMVAPIIPAVLRAQRIGGDLMTASVKANVEDVVRNLGDTSVMLADAVKAGKLIITGGIYELASGQVGFMA